MSNRSEMNMAWLLLVPTVAIGLLIASFYQSSGKEGGSTALASTLPDPAQSFETMSDSASPSVRLAYEKALSAHVGPSSLKEAVDAKASMTIDSKNEADLRLGPRIEELLFQAALNQGPKAPEETKAAMNTLAGTADDPRKAELLRSATVDPKKDPEEAKKVRDQAAAVLRDPVVKPSELPNPEPAAEQSAERGQIVAEQIKDGLKNGKDIKELIEKFDKENGIFQGKVAEALAKGTGEVEKLLGPALGWAKALGSIAPMINNWKNMDDLNKIAGIANGLGAVMEALQPHLTVAFASKKAIALMALKVLSMIIPGINIADMKFPGPDIGGKDGQKPGDNKKEAEKKASKPQEKTPKGGNGKGTSAPKDLTGKEKQEKAKLTDQARDAIKKAVGLPQDASGPADPKKIDREQAQQAAAEAVSGGDERIKTIVLIKLAQAFDSNNPIDTLAEKAAYEAVLARRAQANKADPVEQR